MTELLVEVQLIDVAHLGMLLFEIYFSILFFFQAVVCQTIVAFVSPKGQRIIKPLPVQETKTE